MLRVLEYPSTTDRQKSLFVLTELARQKEYRDELLKQAVPIALKMLRLQQPNNHEVAYTFLKTLSGKQHGARDYLAWERWAAQQEKN